MTSLFGALNGQNMPTQNGNGMDEMMSQLRSDPMTMLRNAGFNVPEEMANDPRATVMHLLQSGQVSNPMMQRIQPMLRMLGVR